MKLLPEVWKIRTATDQELRPCGVGLHTARVRCRNLQEARLLTRGCVRVMLGVRPP